MFRLGSDIESHLRAAGTLVVPTRQRLRALELAWAAGELAARRTVWPSPDALTPRAWLERTLDEAAAGAAAPWPRRLSGAEEWALWREAARHAAREHEFLDDGSLGEALGHAHELAFLYGVQTAGSALPGETQLYLQAERVFRARCRELGAEPAFALATRLESPQRARAMLRGFAGVPPRLLELTGARAPGAPACACAPRVLHAADARAEHEAIAAWCVERLKHRSDARLLVMVPGDAGARERLAALIAQGLDPGRFAAPGDGRRALVSLEGGEPLAALPLVAHALATLRLLSGAEFDVAQAAEWLRAPFLPSPPPPQRALLARRVGERASGTVTLRALSGALTLMPRELQGPARELDARLRRAAAALGDGAAAGRRWSERFAAALAALGWPGEHASTDPDLRQGALRLRELLEEFGELAAPLGMLRRAAAVELLGARARASAYRAADEDAPVSLSPVLADPVVGYDGVWAAGLTADVLPQPVGPDPYLPLAAQRAAGVPQASAALRRAEADALVRAWAAAGAEVVLSAPRREGDLECLASPLLSGLAPFTPVLPIAWLPRRLARAGLTETLEDARGLAWPTPLSPLPGGTAALTLQNQCAFRAYAELRLGAQQAEEAEPGVPMDQRGLILHAALQLLWERLHSQAALTALPPGELRALIAQCVAQAAFAAQAEPRGHRRRSHRPPDGQFDLFGALSPALTRECRRAEALILRLCELEQARPAFTVEATEAVAELALGGGRVRMRLDRIDRLEGGRAILDYKSGRPGHPDWFGERPTHPQLLAYLAALGEDVVALATVNLTAREVRFTGVAAAGGLLPRVRALPAGAPAWPAQAALWRARIEALIAAFLAGDARVDPAPLACQWCHLPALCRIAPHSQALEAPEDADE